MADAAAPFVLRVAVDAPQHSGLSGPLDYASEQALTPGSLVRVPLGKRELLGVVWSGESSPAAGLALKPLTAVFDALPPLGDDWCRLLDFAAGYYQRSVGELASAVLPPQLRELSPEQLAARLRKLERKPAKGGAVEPVRPDLAPEQAQAVERIAARIAGDVAIKPVLLFGVTGSGKTEVYLRAAEAALAAGRQVLVLVPEINLTPQLEARFTERFAALLPEPLAIVSLHSALTPAQRLQNWLAAHLGRARLVLGTRLAVFASLPDLGLIVVDEEHDPSYKQQDGARYSARDLAVWRAHDLKVPVVLGSATPSLESWQHAESGRYERVTLASRIGGGALPKVKLFDMKALPPSAGVTTALTAPLLAELKRRLERGEQSLVFLNRRGYAPVLHCGECQWKSDCPHCSAWRVFHKRDRTLRCHHCGFTERVPQACPNCGNHDIAPIGRGTEKLEEQLTEALPGARVLRIDADSTRRKGELEAQLKAVHDGEVDILVGTQMVTKGHDFRRIRFVAAVNPDGALFSSDFRAPERLFALLMQAGGRAGRDASGESPSEMWVQTWHRDHGLYQALARHDYERFARDQLAERQSAGLPPFAHLALLRAEARTAEAAKAFLTAAAELLQDSHVLVYPPVPHAVARVADVERMQMLVEASQRGRLQAFLRDWVPALIALKREHKAVLRWAVDVDPLAI
ncbi:primosomal protein N' [Roseateles asaccharophilus]|uniref:Replication restart protein PriA n=1 Tax=Roseateles asaccharophilus TaxID=582607 RepID=A0ABU2A869_9BURK|nr:primosomal protein N' [Roseateles asaccharophilus]MDR7332803.1 primosomal protein N' (replication factor Y) [Roseateles asaccharophilus]